METMYNRVTVYSARLHSEAEQEYTPERITDLKPNEIFVFGSNLAGSHGGGAARLAYNRIQRGTSGHLLKNLDARCNLLIN